MTKNRVLKIFVWFLTLFLLAAAMRRMLLQAARSIEQGIDPPGTGTEYYNLRAIDRVLLPGVVWQNELKNEIYRVPHYA